MRTRNAYGQLQILQKLDRRYRLMIWGTIPIDQGVLPPVATLLVELSDKVTNEKKDGRRVSVGLTHCDIAFTEVIKGNDQ